MTVKPLSANTSIDEASTTYYTATHGMFSNIIVKDNVNHIFYDTFKNLGLSVNTGLRLYAPFHPTNWWHMNVAVYGDYQIEKPVYQQGSYDYHKFGYDGNTTQSSIIDKKLGLKAEISAYYYSAGIQGIFKTCHNSEVDAGIKATVLNGQGTIKLAAGDIFYGHTYHIQLNHLNQNNGFYQTKDTRNGTLSFSYPFGKNIAAARNPNTASDEEKRRAQRFLLHKKHCSCFMYKISQNETMIYWSFCLLLARQLLR